MELNKIERKTCTLLRPEVEAALAELAEKYGLKIHAGNASFNDSAVTFKLELALQGYDRDKDEFMSVCQFYDLKPEDYGREFRSRGQTYRLVGINSRSPKYCFMGERADGKRFKFTESIKRQLTAGAV
jgi:hypothetical protein